MEELDFSSSSGTYSVSRFKSQNEQIRSTFTSLLITLIGGKIKNELVPTYFDEAKYKFGSHFNKINPKTLAAAYALIHSGASPKDSDFDLQLTNVSNALIMAFKDSEKEEKRDKTNYKADVYRYYSVISQ